MVLDDFVKEYKDGDILFKQGEFGEGMYIIQEGMVIVIIELENNRSHMSIRKKGEFIGERTIFERQLSLETVRCVGAARLIRIDKKNLHSLIKQDPFLIYRLIQTLSKKVILPATDTPMKY
jgi:CRP-like cAMP-binding protein